MSPMGPVLETRFSLGNLAVEGFRARAWDAGTTGSLLGRGSFLPRQSPAQPPGWDSTVIPVTLLVAPTVKIVAISFGPLIV